RVAPRRWIERELRAAGTRREGTVGDRRRELPGGAGGERLDVVVDERGGAGETGQEVEAALDARREREVGRDEIGGGGDGGERDGRVQPRARAGSGAEARPRGAHGASRARRRGSSRTHSASASATPATTRTAASVVSAITVG